MKKAKISPKKVQPTLEKKVDIIPEKEEVKTDMTTSIDTSLGVKQNESNSNVVTVQIKYPKDWAFEKFMPENTDIVTSVEGRETFKKQGILK